MRITTNEPKHVFFQLRLSLQNTDALPSPILSLNLVQRLWGEVVLEAQEYFTVEHFIAKLATLSVQFLGLKYQDTWLNPH